MTSVLVHSHWVFLPAGRFPDDLFAICDKLMQALLDQEQCNKAFVDSAVAADAEHQLVEIEANAVGDTLSDALATVHAAIRAALHSVGISTPTWPTHDEALSMVLKDLSTEQIQPA
jgi:hypothetical protein